MSNAESAKIVSEPKKRGHEKAQEGASALVAGMTTRTREIVTEAGWRRLRRLPFGTRNRSIMCPCIRTEQVERGSSHRTSARECKEHTGKGVDYDACKGIADYRIY